MRTPGRRSVILTRRWLVFVGAVLLGVGILLVIEARTSYFQARYLSKVAAGISFGLEKGPNPEARFPGKGPYDIRLGYARLDSLLTALAGHGFAIDSQARVSPGMRRIVDRGLYMVYDEKTRAGLQIEDRARRPIFTRRLPERYFDTFADIPPVVVLTLLYIENRELLDENLQYHNPAIEWDRLTRSVLQLAWRSIGGEASIAGASTLATQIEKFRHSPGGFTSSLQEKLRQMETASLRAYLRGERTFERRRQIVLDYLNSLPLAAIAGYGEVIGLAEGMWVWFGVDEAAAFQALRELGQGAVNPEAALAYRQVLALLLSVRRPSFYMATAEGQQALRDLADSYLRLFGEAGVIDRALRDAATEARLEFLPRSPEPPPISFVDRKGVNALRRHLMGLLDVKRLYELDRYDVTIRSTLDDPAQTGVTATLRRLRDPEFVREAGLDGPRLIDGSDPGRLIYSFVLYERGPEGNLVRVQTDNLDAPFDVNQAGRLELGSSAKLRTLLGYLEVIERLHRELQGVAPDSMAVLRREFPDPISRWAADVIETEPEVTLERALDLAMERTYSASPRERFFTGGGQHVFANYDDTYDGSVLSVREGFQHSVNLVFVRLMRDVERFYRYRIPGSTARLLEDPADPRRQEYLQRFADREGRQFVSRFYAKHRGRSFDESVDIAVVGRDLSPQRLAWAYRSMWPDADVSELGRFLQARAASSYSEAAVESLYRRFDPEGISLADRGYLATVHPLELWLVSYLREQPAATLDEVIEASAAARQEVYQWLFRTSRKGAQDQRIRVLLEVEAFLEITRAWRRLGYPFDNLVPSYGTAIGSSGDRPGALAELMGIVVNGGVRLPTVFVTGLEFGRDTPYATILSRAPAVGEQVLSSEVAAVARAAMLDVVESGTAQRLRGAMTGAGGTSIPIGGKTGTGNNQHKVFGRGGRLMATQTLNRTSVFVFFLGDRFYGAVTAYVPGGDAAEYRFTSMLPVALLKLLIPELRDLVGSSR